jgi:hypothetical protein
MQAADLRSEWHAAANGRLRMHALQHLNEAAHENKDTDNFVTVGA